MQKKILIILILIILAAVVGGIYYFQYLKGQPPVAPLKGVFDVKQQAQDIGESMEIEVGGGGVNPMAEMPVVNPPVANPMEEVANPFREPYQNPFK